MEDIIPESLNVANEIELLIDYLLPKLNPYELAVYLYALRKTRLVGIQDSVISSKSLKTREAIGIGKKSGEPISVDTMYNKLQSLDAKGLVHLLGTERNGIRVRVTLPSEIPNLIPQVQNLPVEDIEQMDFFTVDSLRLALLRRESNQCFYCKRTLNESNYIIEHVISRPTGGNTYRNLVAACTNCNNKKGAVKAEEYIRSLYRGGLLSDDECTSRLNAIEELKAGNLKPMI